MKFINMILILTHSDVNFIHVILILTHIGMNVTYMILILTYSDVNAFQNGLEILTKSVIKLLNSSALSSEIFS